MLVRGEHGYEVDDDPARLDLDRVHDWLSTDAYWAIGRPREVLDRAVANSLSYGMYRDGTQYGFARLVTDRATFAYLADVYVDRAVRGTGLGTWLVSSIVDEVRGWDMPRRMVLSTMDAHGVYEKLGFVAMSNPERWMEVWLADPHRRG